MNTPQSDELDFILFVKTFFDGGPWWQDSHFLQHYDHRLIIPSLIFLASSIFDKGNIVNQMYLAISFLTIGTITLYYLLKKTNNQLTWLSIPIAAIIFNAGQYGCYLWGACAVSWFLTSACIILTIFFISKIETSRVAIILAIIFSVIASFTSFMGLQVWVIGGFGLLFLNKKRLQSLLIWFSTAIFLFLIYFTNYTHGSWKGVQIETLFSFAGIEWVLLFLSNGLITHLHIFNAIQVTLGIGIVIIIIGGSVFLKLKKLEFNKIIPWIQLGLFGLLGSVATELGRFGIVGAVASRYIMIAAFAQIAALVIGTIVFLYWYNKLKDKRKKKFAKIIFITIIVFLGIGISSSYYSGWKNGQDWLTQNTSSYECLRDPIFDLKCRGIFGSERQYDNLKILKELQLSVFSKEIEESIDPLLQDVNWKNMKLVEYGKGDIEYINNYPFLEEYYIPSETKIFVDREESTMDVGGWGIFTKKDLNVDSAYVFIDEKINSKSHLGILNQHSEIHEGKTKPSYFSGISGIIDLQKVSDGCHIISIRIVHDIEYYVISTDSQICVK